MAFSRHCHGIDLIMTSVLLVTMYVADAGAFGIHWTSGRGSVEELIENQASFNVIIVHSRSSSE